MSDTPNLIKIDKELIDETNAGMTFAVIYSKDEKEKAIIRHMQSCLAKIYKRAEDNIAEYENKSTSDDRCNMSYPHFEVDSFTYATESLEIKLNSRMLCAEIFNEQIPSNTPNKKTINEWKRTCDYLRIYNQYILRMDDINYLQSKVANGKQLEILDQTKMLVANALSDAQKGDIKKAENGMLLACVNLEDVSEQTGYDYIMRMTFEDFDKSFE